MVNPRNLLWLAAVAALVALVTLLSIAIKGGPSPSQDLTVQDWLRGWDFPGVKAYFEVTSFLTNIWPAMFIGVAGVVFLWLLGQKRVALVLAGIGGLVGFLAFSSGYTLGEIVERSTPLGGTDRHSFPSGHVFGSTMFYGLLVLLAIHYRLRKKLLIPLLIFLAIFILSVGASRIYLQAHWPSDVAAGYLLGALGVLLLVPLIFHISGAARFTSRKLGEDLVSLSCESCQIARSVASVVLLDSRRGTATKVYKPPPVVRLLYWLSFQARFPYESNMAALQAAAYRRKIASLLTVQRFGKDLVAHVNAVACYHGGCSFTTEFVPGKKAENDREAKLFLGQVSETFAEAGLSIWQVNPHNPHAHTNLIRTPEGDFKIVDLESAMVSLFPARGQWASSIKSGSIPVFDDIDFLRLHRYTIVNEASLESTLGPEGLAQLKDATDRCEQAMRAWKGAEPRIWGLLISRIYRLLDLKGFLQHVRGALAGADRAAEAFLNKGLERWEKEGKLDSSKAASLRAYLSSREVQNALHHLGVHLVLSGVLVLPIPGLRSAARFAWTLTFWAKVKFQGPFYRKAPTAGRGSNIHTHLVMLLAIIPGFGAVAYLAAPPLRRRLLIRLMVDQVAWTLPFGIYRRLRLGGWLAPASTRVSVRGAAQPAAIYERAESARKEMF